MRCLIKSSIALPLFFLVTGCTHKIKVITDKRIPDKVRAELYSLNVYYKEDSLLAINPIRLDKDDAVYLYDFLGVLKNGEYKGRMMEVKLSNDKNQVPSEAKKEKQIVFSFKTILCCSNHTPNHCAKNQTAAADSSKKNGCINWKVKLL